MKTELNQCAKCGSGFTSAEKPLKLLPCLHSMCIDCLYGRKSKKPVVEEDELKKVHENEITADSGDELKEKDEAPLSEKNESDNQCVSPKEKENSESENASTEKDSVSSDKETKEKTVDGVDPANHENENSQGNTIENKVADESEKLSSEDATSGHSSAPTENNEQDKTDETENNDNFGDSSEKSQQDEKAESPKTKGRTASSSAEDQFEENFEPVTECPVCRDPIEQPCSNLLDNTFANLDLEQSSEAKNDISHVCTACEEEQVAESYCLQCEEWLCESCVDAHRRVRVTKDHIIQPKDQVKVVSGRSPWEHLLTCKQHKQEQLKFFCEKCEKLTCRDCQLLDHKDHKYQFLDQAAEQYKARLKGSLALMGEKRNKLANNRDEIKQKLQNCIEQKDTLQQEILKQADILVKGIRQAVWGVLSNLASFTDAANKRLNKEIDDVADLVTKFDHCIHFMEDILDEGSSMSLLYSKGNVETKCRKVYHTQVDPQSLKGTLLIQYKHDVNWLLGNLNKIGAIFVNGVRYPPDKNGGQNRQGQAQSSHSGPDHRGGGMAAATSPHLQHMANQPIPGHKIHPEWSKLLPTGSKAVPSMQPNAPPNMTLSAMSSSAGNLPPQLALPNRRGGQGQLWQVPPFPGHLVAGQLLTPQQQTTRPSFTPMRLHHRPATQNQGQGDHSPGTMRSPPQYRMGGEASGSSRSSSSYGTPDPARPASAGMHDGGNSRPDSGGSGGSSALMDIKKEKRDMSPDCVIMSTNMKMERPSVFQMKNLAMPSYRHGESSVEEMQRSLDDVIRAVPMDMSDNLEQISGSSKAPEMAKSKVAHVKEDAVNLKVSSPLAVSQPNGEKETPQLPSPTDEELRENWQGGNSMPGFSLAQADSQGDPNDDYCACCHNGGDVLCCDKCPRVFHLQCHIPELSTVPNGSFICTLCEGDNQVEPEDASNALKRKAPGGLTDHEVRLCERILLELFCHPSSVPFQEPVNRAEVPNYYKIITQPMDFTQIKCKLQRRHYNHYQSIKAFLYDLRQVFINCALYNKAGSEVGKAGKIVRGQFESLVEKLLPQYMAFVQENPSPCFSALHKADLDFGTSVDSNEDGQPSSPKKAKAE